MTDEEQRQHTSRLLQGAATEITSLRRDNQVLGEKMWLVENLLELRHLRGQGGSDKLDVVPGLLDESHRLDQEIEISLEKNAKRKAPEGHSFK